MSYLLKKRPPKNRLPAPELRLWWGILRQAGRDIERGSEQEALDAYEFLSSTGLWMLTTYFNLRESVAIEAIAKLVRTYNVRHDKPLVSRV